MSRSLLVGASSKRRQQTFKFLQDEQINVKSSGQYLVNPSQQKLAHSPDVMNRTSMNKEDGFLSVRMISGRLNNTTVLTPDIVSLNHNNNEHSIGSIATP